MSTLIFLAVWLVLISSSDRKQNILNSVEKKRGFGTVSVYNRGYAIAQRPP